MVSEHMEVSYFIGNKFINSVGSIAVNPQYISSGHFKQIFNLVIIN